MVNKNVTEHIAEARKTLFDEELLGEQFKELEALQGPEDSTFVDDVVNQFLKDARCFFNQVEKELDQATPNIQVLDKVLHQIKGCTASFGAKQLSIICNEMREHVHSGEIQRCGEALVLMKNHHALLDKRLRAYLKLCKQAVTVVSQSSSSGYDFIGKDGVKGREK